MWYEDIKYTSANVILDPEGLKYKDEIVPQGAKIKFRYMRGTFLFGTVATNLETGNTWIECREWDRTHGAGKWRAIQIDQFKSQILPRKVIKRRVRKSTNTA